jgi:hypothetical protein
MGSHELSIKQTIQYTINASTHLTKTPTKLPKHPHIHSTKQVKAITVQDIRIHESKYSQYIKCPQYKVTRMCMVLLSPRT